MLLDETQRLLLPLLQHFQPVLLHTEVVLVLGNLEKGENSLGDDGVQFLRFSLSVFEVLNGSLEQVRAFHVRLGVLLLQLVKRQQVCLVLAH